MPKVLTFQVEGKLIHKFEVQQISETFAKQSIVVRIDHDQYPQEVKLDVVGSAKNYLERLNVGAEVTCQCELTGRAYQRKSDGETDWFTSVKCFGIANAGAGADYQFPKIQEEKDVPF